MLRHLYKKKFKEFGDAYDYDMGYLIELADIYPKKVSYYVKALSLANHNGHLPVELYYAIKIRSMQIADCGPCLKLTIAMAKEAGLSMVDIEALLQGKVGDCPRNIMLGWAYATAVLNQEPDLDTLVREIEIEFGKRGLWDASLAVVFGQFYPVLKRGLGVAKLCEPVDVMLEDLKLAG